MRSSATKYTRRCSWVRRRDHAPAARCFSRSGFPIPVKGSLSTASTKSSARSAVFLSCRTQCFRSSRNSGWKTATRLPLGKAKIPAQLTYRRRRQRPFLDAEKSAKKPLRVRRRSHEMRSLGQRRQLLRADQDHIATAGPANEHRLTNRGDLVAQRRQPRAGLAAGRDSGGTHCTFLGFHGMHDCIMGSSRRSCPTACNPSSETAQWERRVVFVSFGAVEAIMTEAPGRNVDEPSAPVFSEAESSRG